MFRWLCKPSPHWNALVTLVSECLLAFLLWSNYAQAVSCEQMTKAWMTQMIGTCNLKMFKTSNLGLVHKLEIEISWPSWSTCILHPSTSAHPLQRAWRRNANASKPPLNWLYSSGRSLLAPHEEDSKSFGSSACCLGDTPWVLPQPPWGDSSSLPGHPISFQLVPPFGCTTAQPARWPHPQLSDLLWRRLPVSSPRRASCPPRGCSSASTPRPCHLRQEPCSASGSRFPALPPPWPQMWSLRKAAVAPQPALTCQTFRWWCRPQQTRWPPKWTCTRHCRRWCCERRHRGWKQRHHRHPY